MLLFVGGIASSLTISTAEKNQLDLSSFMLTSEETFDNADRRRGGLIRVLSLGEQKGDAWKGSVNQGCYNLSNAVWDGAVRYYYLKSVPRMASQSSLSEGALSVDVFVEEGNDNSAAGLIYQFNAETKNYYAFILYRNHTYAIYRRTHEGLRKILSGTAKRFSPNGNNTLTILTRGVNCEFYINSMAVACIGDTVRPSGHVGIVAFGKGAYRFDNFKTYGNREHPVAEPVVSATATAGQETSAQSPVAT
jgi:hypothetical protein